MDKIEKGALNGSYQCDSELPAVQQFPVQSNRFILVNDFYKNLPKEKVDKIKKAGAISGCTAIVL